MIRSMTGYGRGEAKGRFGTIKVEIKSLNNKFFDIIPRLPNGLNIFEDRVREYIQKKIKRGRINLSVNYDESPARARKHAALDRNLASALLKEIKSFGKEHNLKGDIDINRLMMLPGIITYENPKTDTGELWANLKRALDEAIKKLDESRISEGKRLSKDLFLRVVKIEKAIDAIEKRSSKSVEHYKAKFSKRIKELSGGVEIDKEQLAQEVALYAKNCDITEEVIRIKSHAVSFEKSLTSGGEKGKTLDFVAQELIREINTIGSKANDFPISNHVIAIKGEIEKIREQLKNIE
ncbi:MAG: YicC family protein [Candidatus Omnitrophica bacterium]|nr:YicC family protein [Candidatus Omnitrophota bacterium]MBU4488060.1 YicC family protein [Candidatus Omnitrophota bacterium]MCG2704851.1 YicC family protein [Candidatus Omnitrophota bacterium]